MSKEIMYNAYFWNNRNIDTVYRIKNINFDLASNLKDRWVRKNKWNNAYIIEWYDHIHEVEKLFFNGSSFVDYEIVGDEQELLI